MVTLIEYMKSQQGQGKPLNQILSEYQRLKTAPKTAVPSTVISQSFVGPPAPKVTAPKVTTPFVPAPKVTTPTITAPKTTTPVAPTPKVTAPAPAPPIPQTISQILSKIVPTQAPAPKVSAPVAPMLTAVPKAITPAPSLLKTLTTKIEVAKEKVAEAKAKEAIPFVGPPAPVVKAPIEVTKAPATVSSILQKLETQKEAPATKAIAPSVVPVKETEKAPTVKPVAVTITPTAGISPTIKVKLEEAKAKITEAREQMEVTKERVEIQKGTAPKEALTETGMPFYSDEERIISRTNPTLAQSMYTSRTGVKLTSTTLSGTVSVDEKKIAEKINSAPSNIKSPNMKRDWAVKQLVDSGDLPYGFDGYEPGVPAVEPTEYMKNYGWKPSGASWTYNNAISDVDRQISQVQKNISAIEANIPLAKDNIAKLTTNRQAVIDSERGTLWKAPDVPQATLDKLGIERKNEYTRVEMTKILNYGIQANEDAINQQSNIHELQKNINQLEATKKSISTYQQKGYSIEYTDQGYQFKYPTATEAHVGIFGEERTKVMLTATAEMESPLGIGTFFSAVQSWATGDKSIQTRKVEELAQQSFGLQSALREGGVGSYVGKVLTSGAVTTGIVIPVLTLGAGYGASAISAGASGLTRTGGVVTQTLMKVGESPVGKTILAGGKVTAIGVAGVTTVVAGVSLGEAWAEQPGKIAESLGTMVFGIGMAVGGFKAGQEAFVQRTTTVPVKMEVTDLTSGKVKEVTIARVPKPTDVTGQMDILQTKVAGSTENKVNLEGIGTQKITGRPDVKVTIKGEGLQMPGEDVSLSQGTGTMTWTEKVGKVEHTFVKEFNWSGEGKYIQEVGPTKIYEVAGKSQLQAWTLEKGVGQTVPMNEPTISSGLARVTDVGKMQFKTEPIPKGFEDIFAKRLATGGKIETWESRGVKTAEYATPKEVPTVTRPELLPGVEQYTYKGEFFQPGGKVWGKAFQSGRIFTFEAEQPIIKITEVPAEAPVVKVTTKPIVHTPWKFPKAEAPMVAGGPSAEPTTAGLISEVRPVPAVPQAPLTLGGLLDSISAEVVKTVGPVGEAVAPMAKPAVTAVSAEASLETITEPAGGFFMQRPGPRKISARRAVGFESPFTSSVDELMAGRTGIVPSRFDVEEVKPSKPAEVKPVVKPTPAVKPIFASLVEPSMVAPVTTAPTQTVPTITRGQREVTVPKEALKVTPIVSPIIGPRTITGQLGLGKEKPAPPVGIVSPIEKGAVEPVEKQAPWVETGQESIQETTPLEKQIQSLTQEQMQEQATAQIVTPVAVTTTVPFKFTPWIPITPPPTQYAPQIKRPQAHKKPEKAPKQRLEVARKEFLADIASVTRSQAIYGKATHPALTKEEWAKAEATGFAVVPTVEIEEAEKRGPTKNMVDSLGLGEGRMSLLAGLDSGLKKGKKGKGFDLGIGGI